MNKKAIKSKLRDAVREWTDELPMSIRDHAAKGVFVTGGAIVSLLLGEKVKDYDLYFKNHMVAEMVARHYADGIGEVSIPAVHRDRVFIRIQGSGVYIPSSRIAPLDPLAPPKHEVACITSNAITLTNKIQLITRFVGKPEDIHKNYDFVHCTSYYDPKEDKLVIPAEAATAILTKELVYVGSKYPLASIIRTRKFINRGWTVNAGQYLKMALQLSEYDLTNVEVLHDQLMGIDAAYFHSMLSTISESDRISGNVDATYLIGLINKFF